MSSPSYTFSGGALPANFTPNSYEDVGYMLGKVAEQIIREVSAEDKLSVFDKMPVLNGDTIEQTVIQLASARAYDSTGANALSRKTPSLAVRMFNSWNRITFDTTVDMALIRKVLIDGKGGAEVATKLVSVLGESDKFEKYTQTKNLFKWGRQDQSGKVLKLVDTIAYGTNSIDYKGVLKSLKNVVSGMQYVNTSFNTGSVNRKTDAKDIFILMPYKLKNELDVEELAGVFNLDKAEIKSRIIEIDTDVEEISGVDTYVIYVVDRNAVLAYTRLYEMADQKNADGLFWNYFLHTERLYGISPLFDACYFWVQTQANPNA